MNVTKLFSVMDYPSVQVDFHIGHEHEVSRVQAGEKINLKTCSMIISLQTEEIIHIFNIS